MQKRETNSSKKEKIFPQNKGLELFSELEQIIMNLTEENINFSAIHTTKLFDFSLPYSFNLVISQLIYYAFLSQRNKCTTYFKFFEIIQKKEEEKIGSKYNIIEIFLNYIIKNNSQEALYLIEQMIRQNLIDANITKIIPSKYFAHYKTTTENKEWINDRFFSTFIKNFEELSKNDWELHQQYVKEGHNPNEIAKIIRNDEIEKLQEISSQINFDFNQKIEPSLYESCSFINEENVTLIDYAAFFSSVQCFKYLLMNGANVENTGKYAVAGGNEEIIHLCEQCCSSFKGSYEIAIEFHRNDIFRYLYENKMDNLYEVHDTEPHRDFLKYEDLIKFCVISGNYEILSFLEGEGTKINESIINESAKIGNVYLLIHFLHNNKKIPKNILSYTIESENVEVVEYIILKHRKEINFNSVNNNNKTPLLYVAEKGYTEIVKLLLEQEGIDINAKDRWDGRTALILASEKGHTEIVKLLLEQEGIDINAKGNSGETALINASRYGYIEIVKLLLEQEGIDINAKDEWYGKTALILTSRDGNLKVVKLLLEHKIIDLNVKDDDWEETPLIWASKYGHKEIVKILLEKEGTNINAKNKWGQTALIKASSSGYTEIAKLLLGKKGIDVNVQDIRDGETPIVFAAKNGHTEIVKLLLEQEGIDINAKDKDDGCTALMKASRNGYAEIVKLLLEQKGINIKAKTKNGETALDLASSKGNQKIVALFHEFF